jgi:hypothetical protein
MNGMGSWKLSGVSPAIVISSGVVAVGSKDKDQIADFSLRYWELKKMIENNPKAKVYTLKKITYMGLIRAVHDNRLDELGNIIEETRSIDCVKEDNKRDYKLTRHTKLAKCGGDLLKRTWRSKPRDISQMMVRDVSINYEGGE